LKQQDWLHVGAQMVASPGLKAGRGLKRRCKTQPERNLSASPGLKAGRGLKLWTRARLSGRA